MRIPVIFLIAAFCIAAQPASGAGIAFHVSPAGNDAWTGTLASPTSGGTDGPFRSLERARDAVRALKTAGKYPKSGGVTVSIGGGMYRMEKTRASPLGFVDETVAGGRAGAGGRTVVLSGECWSGLGTVTLRRERASRPSGEGA